MRIVIRFLLSLINFFTKVVVTNISFPFLTGIMPRRKLNSLNIVQVPRVGEETNEDDLSGSAASQVPETVENIEIEGIF